MMLTGLKINPITNSISSSDGGKVILQINGQTLHLKKFRRYNRIKSSGLNIQIIQESDLKGASKIINYIIERKDKGGVIGVDLMNSLKYSCRW